jgi:PAS domain S-box-containing protein
MKSTLTPEMRLMIPMGVLSAILMFLGGVILYSSSDNIRTLIILKDKIELSKNISGLIHNIQRERGLSSGFLMGNINQFKNDLISQRSQTDKEIVSFHQRLMEMDKQGTVDQKLQSIFTELTRLSEFRMRIDSGKVSAYDAIHYFSTLNNRLLEIIVDISKHSRIPEITQSLLAYMNFMFMKEYLGIERAVGAKLLSPSGWNTQTLKDFTKLIALKQEHEKMFLFYMDSKWKQRYHTIIDPKTDQSLARIRSTIFRKRVSDAMTTPKEWFDFMSQKIDALNRFSLNVETKTTRLAETKMNTAQNIFLFIMLLTLFSAIVFFWMMRTIWLLAREERRLRLVADKYIISSVTDTQGRIIEVSQAFCTISGYTREELIGKPHNIVRHPDMSSLIFRELWEQIRRGESWSGKVKNLKKDGGFYWVYAHIEPLHNRDKQIDAYISIRLDITDNELLTQKIQDEEHKRRIAVEMMQQQARMAQMGEMLNMIAHQWRQPLSAITSAASALRLKGRLESLDAETVEDLTGKINTFTYHLSTTVDDFKNFFRTDKEKTPIHFTHILESTLMIVQHSLEQHNIQIRVMVEHDCALMTYENELKQVILNLLKNAEDALVQRGVASAWITLFVQGNLLVIEDNGGGIEESKLEQIFDPYFSTKSKKDGTGLGLYMSKMIIEEHCGGVLKVENTQVGARFTIQLEEECV